ncbi:hypothetical protein [Arthrobacter sp. NPDC090010]|uniref:hypothetical protein n=1 Tax=Arthrobacter sp. NPDC090010 TaxID=3363942 RepID=UPI00380B9B7E
MTQELLVVADQKAGTIRFLEPHSGKAVAGLDQVVLAEHAGILGLGGGLCAFVDDGGGSLIVVDPFREHAGHGRAEVQRIPVAIPGEHLACDPSGRFLAVTTGLGLSWEPWSDLLTVVDREAPGGPLSRRVRTRPGEPGVVIAGTPESLRAVVRHREPGAIESLSLQAVLDQGVHCAPLRGELLEEFPDDGHGDAYDPLSGTLFVATGRGLERLDVRSPLPRTLPPLPWQAPGRAYFLRFDPRRRILVAVLRAGGDEPRAWPSWSNTLWVHELETGVTRTAPLGEGLIFRFALTAGGVAVARVHPDGDRLSILETDTLAVRGDWELPAMDHAPRPGHEPWDDADRRAIAASPSSELVAVTRGGHGELHLIDTSLPGAPLRTVHTEGPLHDGGHLGWLSTASAVPGDTVGR